MPRSQSAPLSVSAASDDSSDDDDDDDDEHTRSGILLEVSDIADRKSLPGQGARLWNERLNHPDVYRFENEKHQQSTKQSNQKNSTNKFT